MFCLYPHQSAYVVPEDAVVLVPDDVPAERAVLAGTVETAVNALWDAAPLVGDSIAVVGAGMVGCCVARLLAGIPGVQVTLVDIDTSRAEVAAGLGVEFASSTKSAASAISSSTPAVTPAGLRRSLELLADDATVIELSWYGDKQVQLGLGGAFHSRRLAIRGEPGRCRGAGAA